MQKKFVSKKYRDKVKDEFRRNHHPCKGVCENREIGCAATCEKLKQYKIDEIEYMKELDMEIEDQEIIFGANKPYKKNYKK